MTKYNYRQLLQYDNGTDNRKELHNIYIHYIQKGQDLSHDKSRSYYTFAYISSNSEGPKKGFACIESWGNITELLFWFVWEMCCKFMISLL